MKRNSFNIVVLKEYETNTDGKVAKHQTWNRVGRAWGSPMGRTMTFELFLFPGQKYVLALRGKDELEPSEAQTSENFDEIPF